MKHLLSVGSAPHATGSAKDTKWSTTDTGTLKDPPQRKGHEPVLTVFCNTCEHRKVWGDLGGQRGKCLILLGWDQDISENRILTGSQELQRAFLTENRVPANIKRHEEKL